MAPRRIVVEVALVFAAVAAGTGLITLLAREIPGLAGYEQILMGLLFLFAAIKLAQREPDGLYRYGIALSGLLVRPDPKDERRAGPLGLFDLGRAIRGAILPCLRETLVALAIAAVVFPPFIAGFYQWNVERIREPFGLVFALGDWEFALTQILVIALPEEAFFRGYVYTRLSDRFPKRFGILPAHIPWIASSLMFAVIHIVSIPHPARLAVFFPALLFCWVRTWRGGIGAAMLLHGLSNVLSQTLMRGWHLT